MGNQIRLEPFEMRMAKFVAHERNNQSHDMGLEAGHGLVSASGGVGENVTGALGEMAFAKFKNLYWSGSVGTFKTGGDVGNIQVRSTNLLDRGMIIRADDRENDVFVAVNNCAPVFFIRGWLYGHEAKQTEWRKNPGGRGFAWFVPQHALRPIETIELFAAT